MRNISATVVKMSGATWQPPQTRSYLKFFYCSCYFNMICFSASVQLIKTCSHPFLKHSLKVLQLSGWWVVFTVQLASFLATCWLLLQWTYNKWYPHTYFFNPVQLIFFSNKFYCAGTTLKKYIYKKAHLQFFQTTPCNFRNTPWDSHTRLSGSESRLHVCMCLLCLIYHLASALTKPLSGYGSALFVYVCLCVLHSPTFRLGLTEQIAWLLKRCWGLRCFPPSPTRPAELRRCPGTVGALVCISPCQ